MNLAAGIAMILLSGAMYYRYSPRDVHGKQLCGLVLTAGIVSCFISDGGPALLEVFRFGALGMLAVSSVCYLRRQYLRRTRLARHLQRCHACGKIPQKNRTVKYPKKGRSRRACA